MKILYAIQGTGNGHVSRAREIIPILKKKGDLDLLISGTQADVDLPYPIKYRFKGLCFVFGKKGGIDVMATYRKGNLKRLYDEIKSLPVENYDLVISDFEPVSAWACKRKHKHCVGLSHQAAVIHNNAPRPIKKDMIGKAILFHYAPVSKAYGFHFAEYGEDVFTPVIRSEIRMQIPEVKPHYTVYLPAYSDKRIIKILSALKNIEWQVFSKHCKKTYREGNISIRPVLNEAFIESLISCTGILCGAGFETPAEALYLQKKLLVIPMKGQYEQQCNAAALATMNIPVIKSLKEKHLDKIKSWTRETQSVPVSYPDETAEIINRVIRENYKLSISSPQVPGKAVQSIKALKENSLERILKQSGN
jgi:uncharacterized protein (TIGR00661 family)